MSRKTILSLAAAATVAVATLAAQSADARGFGGGFGGGGGMSRGGMGGGHVAMTGFAGRTTGRAFIPIHTPHPIIPIIPIPHKPPHWVFHPHGHWIFREGRWVIVDDVVVDAAPVVTAPGPCTCLTKTYTQSGLVVFADVCTKESASAPALSDHADASQAPTSPVAATAVPISVVPTAPNYAGRTYEDYLAANPQAANPQAANPAAPQAAQRN
jgi:hypothetical protein